MKNPKQEGRGRGVRSEGSGTSSCGAAVSDCQEQRSSGDEPADQTLPFLTAFAPFLLTLSAAFTLQCTEPRWQAPSFRSLTRSGRSALDEMVVVRCLYTACAEHECFRFARAFWRGARERRPLLR